VSNKVYNFKIDEWVRYIPFPDNQDA